jgi:hypothetical protein
MKTGRWIMSKKVIFVLMYPRHKPLRHIGYRVFHLMHNVISNEYDLLCIMCTTYFSNSQRHRRVCSIKWYDD